jgi:HNH endonuclease
MTAFSLQGTPRRMPNEGSIRRYWATRLDLAKKGFDSDLEFLEHGICFACGWEKTLERAHITPRCDGGPDSEDNLHMLCKTCHKVSEFKVGDEYWAWFYSMNMWTGFLPALASVDASPEVIAAATELLFGRR